MKEIELYIHTADHREPKLVKISEDATVEELLKRVAPEAHGELSLFIENEHEARERHHRLCDCGAKHRHHVHCHRCREIAVTVSYNGDQSHNFAPSTTIEKVLHWALDAFKLKGVDALDKVLRLTDAPNEVLPESAHIGSLAKSHCKVRLNLTGKVEVNG
jgi:hypothetical protein